MSHGRNSMPAPFCYWSDSEWNASLARLAGYLVVGGVDLYSKRNVLRMFKRFLTAALESQIAYDTVDGECQISMLTRNWYTRHIATVDLILDKYAAILGP